jgi:hypothetical protein
MADSTPPVPPDELKEKWLDEWDSDSCPPVPFVCPEPTDMAWFFSDRAAAWGYAQAIPEREELAELLARLADELHSQTCLYEGYSHPLVLEARAAAERLRPTKEDF